MEKRKKALLIAFVIGDGYIRVDPRVKNHKGTLKFCHSIKQKEYLEYKVSLLHSLVGGNKPNIREYLCKSNFGNFMQVRAEKTHKYFRVLRKWLYPNKYSYLKYLTPEAIAIWFMDDGSCIVNNRHKDGTPSSCRTQFHTCLDTIEEAQSVCDYFEGTWSILFKPYKDKTKYSIRCNHKEGLKFHKLVHPFIIPSMLYKQKLYYDTSAQPSSRGDDIV